MPAYAAVVGFWAPFGSFLTGLASYALGPAFWSRGAGLAALMAALLIPDAGLLNIAHPLYNYFWLQHIAPARSLWCRNRRNSADTYRSGSARRATYLDCIRSSNGRASGSFQGSRLHGGISATAFLCHPCLASTQTLALARDRARVVAGLALLPLANRFYVGPNVHFDFSGSALYWKLLAKMASGTRVESWYQMFRADHPFPSHLAQAIGLLCLVVWGFLR